MQNKLSIVSWGWVSLGLAVGGARLFAAAPAAPDAASPLATGPAMKGEITAALPVIPDARFNVTDFGAVGDAKTLNTDAFKKAVAAVAQAGGGHLDVPAGTFKTLQFTLTSHIDLHLEPGAIIKAPDNFAEYGIPDPNVAPSSTTSRPGAEWGGGMGGGMGGKPAPLISSPTGTTDVAITGSGTIDGSGAIFWIWSDKVARKYPPGRRIVGRPNLVALSGTRVHVDGVTLTNSPMFHLVPRGQDITIENVRIVAPSDAPNSDAMDPGGQRIVIRNCEIDTGDDDVAVQNGSRDVLIEDLTIFHGHGISIGSGTRSGVSHMVVRRCSFNGADNGLRIKSYRGNGGDVHDIQYSDIVMRNVRRPFDLNMLYNGNANSTSDVGSREAGANQTQNLPNFHDIHFSNITVVRSPIAGRILGLPEQPVSDITFSHMKVQSDRGALVQDGKDITFTDVDIRAAVGEPLVLDNGSVIWNGTAKSGTSGGPSAPFYPGGTAE